MANKIGAKKVLIMGNFLVLICMVLLALISTKNTVWFHVLPVTALLSFGAMPAFVTMTILATSGVKDEDHGLVSGILNTTGQLGGSLGLAVLTAIAASRTAHMRLHSGVSEAEALVSGYSWGLGAGAAFVGLALLLVWFGLKKPNVGR